MRHGEAFAVVIQSDGKIVVGGDGQLLLGCPPTMKTTYFVLARLNADATGTLDSSFGADSYNPGIVYFQGGSISHFDDEVHAL